MVEIDNTGPQYFGVITQAESVPCEAVDHVDPLTVVVEDGDTGLAMPLIAALLCEGLLPPTNSTLIPQGSSS